MLKLVAAEGIALSDIHVVNPNFATLVQYMLLTLTLQL